MHLLRRKEHDACALTFLRVLGFDTLTSEQSVIFAVVFRATPGESRVSSKSRSFLL